MGPKIFRSFFASSLSASLSFSLGTSFKRAAFTFSFSWRWPEGFLTRNQGFSMTIRQPLVENMDKTWFKKWWKWKPLKYEGLTGFDRVWPLFIPWSNDFWVVRQLWIKSMRSCTGWLLEFQVLLGSIHLGFLIIFFVFLVLVLVLIVIFLSLRSADNI